MRGRRAAPALLLLATLWTASAAAVEVPPEAFATGAVDDGDPRAETRLIIDRASVAPGERFRVGVLFTLDPEWHVYGEDPGEAGLPTSVVWRAEGAEVGELHWPSTQTFVDPSGRITTEGYSERVVLEADATVTAAEGELRVTAEVDYLACRIKCLPGSAKLTRDLPIGVPAPSSDEVVALFDHFGRTRQPSEVATAPAVEAQAASTDAPPALAFWQLLLLAFLGGMLLNLMPCVFPVIALKVFGFVSTATHRPTALRHAAAYAAGILVSMGALAAVVIAVKAGGAAVGWGFQFQEPRYLVGLTLVVILFALNLLGVFDVQTLPLPSRGSGESPGRSLADGALAVVLATPCSAPFLGTAVGFALASSAATIAAAFLAVGVGLAAPFVVASAVPGIGKRLPTPGPWMQTLERVLGFVLLATAVWLVWVFARVVGADGVGALLATAVCAAFGAWVYGRLQYAEGWRRTAGRLALVAGLVVPLAALRPWTYEPTPAAAPATNRWQTWDEARIAQEQAAGRVVFVDFTADWCITCKVNERVALSSAELWAAFAARDVVAMKADWTRRDERIRGALAKFGRAGVPMYLVYPAGGGAPEVLPEVLTESIVLSAVDRGLQSRRAE